ncbi:MAG: ABC transporter permease [Candidatus Neomarinimicrobiota bacterium]|nr:MAG: ABC transporter permease [Candidatus Neomarinimicrobiota bacterium]
MFKNYLKIAWKILLRHKLFTFISLFGISFTLLILIVITSFIDHTVGRQAPENRQNRILTATYFRLTTESGGNTVGPVVSYYFLDRYVRSLKTPEAVTISSFHKNVITYKDKKKFNFALKYTDGEFWNIYDFKFLEGKGFSSADVEQATPVAVITADVRKKYFENQSAVGEYIQLGENSYRVIGVVDNVSLLRILPYSDVWVPITLSKANLMEPKIVTNEFPGYFAAVLARSRSDIPAIKAEFRKHLSQVEFTDGHFNAIWGGVERYSETISRVFMGSMKEPNLPGLMLVLFLLMLLFMILPTINLVNINISRIMERSSEIGVRKAFGASSKTLVGQFIVENIIITLLGGIIAVFLALIILSIINNSGIIPHLHLVMNWRVFYKSMLIAVFFGFLSGVYPAYKMSRLHPAEVLRGGE